MQVAVLLSIFFVRCWSLKIIGGGGGGKENLRLDHLRFELIIFSLDNFQPSCANENKTATTYIKSEKTEICAMLRVGILV